MHFFLSSNAINLSAIHPHATVEAEYGDVTVAGSILTMAHHGKNAGNRAPCAYSDKEIPKGIEVVGLSHVDLDTIGGCAAILGVKVDVPTFWALAEFVDLNGPHRLPAARASEADIESLYAFWAWSREHRCFAPRDGSVADVTDFVVEAISALTDILMRVDCDALIEAGRAMRAHEAEEAESSFVRVTNTMSGRLVVVRESAEFVNHLYGTPAGVADAVVAHNTSTGSVTLSFERAPWASNARELVQALWGELAGGHAGIAGSPRNVVLSLDDAIKLADLVCRE